MGFGGYFPSPERYGTSKPDLKFIADSLDRAMGNAYDTSEQTIAHIENEAYARAIIDVWENNQRMTNQFLPSRLSSFIPRWEKILGLYPKPDETPVERRVRIVEIFDRISQLANHTRIYDILSERLGQHFVELREIAVADAIVWWPVNPNPIAPWASTVAHILIQTRLADPINPDAWTEQEFNEAITSIGPILEDTLPAWVTWDWYRDGIGHPPSAWAPDPDAGFYLDEDFDLDYEIFDV